MKRILALMSVLALSAVFNPVAQAEELDMLAEHALSYDLQEICGSIPMIDRQELMRAFGASRPITPVIAPTLDALQACQDTYNERAKELQQLGGGSITNAPEAAQNAWRKAIDVNMALDYYIMPLSSMMMRDSLQNAMGDYDAQACMKTVPELDRKSLIESAAAGEDISPIIEPVRTKLSECSQLASSNADARYTSLMQIAAYAQDSEDPILQSAEEAWSAALLRELTINVAVDELDMVAMSYGLYQFQN